MALKRISKAVILKAINKLTHMQDFPFHSDIRIAQAQLEADFKEYEIMLATKNIQIDTLQKAHNAVIREIFRWVRYEKCNNPDHPTSIISPPKSLCYSCIKELEQKYLGGK